MKHIVILGGGYGGVYTAKHLLHQNNVKITLINRDNYFLFTPMLHEVATGGLNRHNIVEPIRSVLHNKNFSFIEDEVKSINFTKKTVQCNGCAINYDYLVIGIGATTNFFNIPGAKEYCLDLKSIHAAADVRNSIITSLEEASKRCHKQDVSKHLNFVVVGAGPTGVELAGEIAEFVKQMTEHDYQQIDFKDCNVYLVQRSGSIMPFIHETSRKTAQQALVQKGVTLLLNSAVTRVFKEGIEINNKKKVSSTTVIWTSGVKPNKVQTTPKVVNERGSFPVNEFLQVKGLKHVFALGDCALFFNKGEERPVPALAQTATIQAGYVARNIVRSLERKPLVPCEVKLQGLLVSVGQKFAVADLAGIRFKGFFAWWLWRTVYLFKLVGKVNKWRVALDWTMQLFAKRDTSKL